ncbi:T9SS type A sorting domain-containing protein [Pontibacter sp. FD36]|uniref:T9SS type A sorting domain-containing protein n=1 Tax=Pontibacter sp. FD36 TaxID=2789860 RepID=UPI0018AB4F63|nr:T9SS type A sorting domain-containing protein [Pontibacter sp. FD36]MBF8962048.1 T9SS type A sorting domain-containing protein [Pontibacter sp. FD36]
MEKNYTQIIKGTANQRLHVNVTAIFFTFILIFFSSEVLAQTPTITPPLDPICATVGRSVDLTIEGSGFRLGTAPSNAGNVRVEFLLSGTNTSITGTPIVTTALNEGQIVLTIASNSAIVSSARTIDIRVSNRIGNGNQWTNPSNRISFTIFPALETLGAIAATMIEDEEVIDVTGATVCGGGDITFTIPEVPNATGYVWDVPETATLIEGNDNIVTYRFPNDNIDPIEGVVTVFVINGCQDVRIANTVVTILREVTVSGDIEIDTDDPNNSVVSGENATFIAQSEIIDAGDVLSYQWFESVDGAEWSPVINETSRAYYVESVPSESFAVRVDITARQENACYSNLPSGVERLETGIIVPLPVELLYFTAVKRGTDVAMEWATASELDNKGFEVQVSLDGQNFRSLGFVDSKVNTTSLKQLYTFVDREKGKLGTRYYRLKQVDLDGKFEYFSTKAVEFGAITANSIKAYPNPFHSELQLNIDSEATGDVQLTVTNTMGQQLMQRTIRVERGANTEKLELDPSLPRGIYIVSTTMGGFKSQFKLMKE